MRSIKNGQHQVPKKICIRPLTIFYGNQQKGSRRTLDLLPKKHESAPTVALEFCYALCACRMPLLSCCASDQLICKSVAHFATFPPSNTPTLPMVELIAGAT